MDKEMMPEKKKSYSDQFDEVWDGMKGATGKGGCVGPFQSPMGRGIVIKSGSEWDDGTTEYHHFLTHDAEGKALKNPRHFVQTERKHMESDKPMTAGKAKKG